MKVLTHIRCFLYNALNWNLRLATFLLINEIIGERKYKIHTIGLDELNSMKKSGTDISNSSIYTPVSYYLLENTFKHIPHNSRRHFIDFGCGYGRAICIAAHHNFKHVSGIDFSKEFCEIAERNMVITQQQFPSLKYNIIHADVLDYTVPKDADCLFFFNPFNELIMSSVVKNVLHSLTEKPRTVNVVYVNPLHKQLWMDAGFKEVYHTQKLKYLEQSILTFKP